MDALIYTSFANEFNSIRDLLKFPTEFKIEGLRVLEGEIARNKISLICGGQGRKNVEISLNNFFKKNMVHGALLAGFAGSLVSGLEVGQIVTPNEFVLHSPEIKRPAVYNPIASIYPQVACVTVDQPVLNTQDKKNLAQQSKCHIVDMESFAFAEYMFLRGTPFVVVRSILDDLYTDASNFRDLDSNSSRASEALQKGVIKILEGMN